jgi:hypothetical protein
MIEITVVARPMSTQEQRLFQQSVKIGQCLENAGEGHNTHANLLARESCSPINRGIGKRMTTMS